jgi:hypothetical protein
MLGFGGAFWCLDVLLDYATHALVLGAHVFADAVQSDRVLEAHLALGVHFSFPDKLGALLDALRFDLRMLVGGIRGVHFAMPTCSSRFLYSVGA